MNCQEASCLLDLHLDGELEPGTQHELRNHLATCPSCRVLFTNAEQTDGHLFAKLREGGRSGAIWERAEQAVRAVAPAPLPPARPDRPPERAWLAWLWPSPRFYGGLAAAWCMVLGLHLLSPSATETTRAQIPPPDHQTAHLLLQQRQELANLLELPAPDELRPKSSPHHSMRPVPQITA